MQFTQTNFAATELPNIWERQYTLPDGNIATITHLGPDTDYVPFTVQIHSKDRNPSADWWDSVVADLGAVDTIEAAEKMILEARAQSYDGKLANLCY